MRILHTLFTRGFTGTERHVTDLCNYQAKEHQVALLVRYDYEYSQEVNFLTWLSPEVEVFKVSRYFPPPWIWWHVAKWRPDIVHSHHKRDVKYIGRCIKSIPRIGTLHVRYQNEYSRCDGLICIAAWQRDEIPRAFRGLVTQIANWLPPHFGEVPQGSSQNLRRELGIPEDAYVVGSIGRFAPEKGFADLADAFVKADMANSYLVIVGEGLEREGILRKYSKHRIILPGATSDPFQYYELFDVFVLSSRFEPFGLVLLEAMSAKLPIISTTLGGPMEILPKNGAMWVDAGDVDAMASVLIKAQRLGKRKPVVYDMSNFHVETQAAKIYDFYQRVLSTQYANPVN